MASAAFSAAGVDFRKETARSGDLTVGRRASEEEREARGGRGDSSASFGSAVEAIGEGRAIGRSMRTGC